MAFTLKKHTSNQLESARLNDVNDNWGDIEQAIDILQTNASLCQSGRVSALQVAPNSVTTVDLIFPKPFTQAPNVVASVENSPQLTMCSVRFITATSAQIRFYNGATYPADMHAQWIAVGK
jgi:hypothetical protein